MPCSAAILRTSGEDFVRSRSSMDPPLPPVAGAPPGVAVGAGAVEGCEEPAGFAIDSVFGGGPPAAAAIAGAAGADPDAAPDAGVAAAGAALTAPASVSIRA